MSFLDTIDIEEFAGKVKTGFVTFFTSVIYAEAVSLFPWIATSVVGDLVYKAIEWAVGIAATKGGLVAYIINTKVYTTDQAKDYVTTINKLELLPENVSDADWDKAEREANRAFKNLINYKS